MLVDTHCHIHEPSYGLNADTTLQRAQNGGVAKVICVGTGVASSYQALAFAHTRPGVHASIGVHPHETQHGLGDILTIKPTAKLVAVGEIGLDYYYMHSSREVQVEALEEQLAYAVANNLPVIFHVREAFDDFWPIFDNFAGSKGVLHSFTDTMQNLEEGLKRGLYIGVNGISTFTKDVEQQKMFQNVPLERMVLETDAPYLTPTPFRGSINEPVFVRNVAEYHANLRSVSLEHISAATTANATALFALL